MGLPIVRPIFYEASSLPEPLSMNVVVVESPAKAKTINKYLGKNFTVLASYGHVRDLPAKDGSVRPDEDFAMDWETDGRSAKRGAETVAAADPRHRPGSRRRGDFLARSRAPQPARRRQGQARGARRVQRHHPPGGA